MINLNKDYQTEYEQTKSVRYAWQGIALWLEDEEGLRPWMIDYLKDTARRILDIPDNVPTKHFQPEIVKALRVCDKRIFFKKSTLNYSFSGSDQNIYEQVNKIVEREEVSVTTAQEQVGKKLLKSKETIRDAYRRAKDFEEWMEQCRAEVEEGLPREHN